MTKASGAPSNYSEEQYSRIVAYINQGVQGSPKSNYSFKQSELERAAGYGILFTPALTSRLEKEFRAARPKWGSVKWVPERKISAPEIDYTTFPTIIEAHLLLSR